MSDMDIVIERVDAVSEDRRVPNNIKRTMKEIIEQLQNEQEDLALRVNAAISLLDEASNDPNIEQFTRTELWSIASMLESLQTH